MRYLYPGEFWAYRVVAADRPLTDYGACADFVALWRSKQTGTQAGERLPARRDFAFHDFRGWHGWITIDEVRQDPFDLRCRLFGTQVVELHGADQTGRWLSSFLEDPEERPFYEDYLACHDRAAREHALVRGIGSMQHRGRALGGEWIGLPCADDGVTVTHFISLMRTFSLGLLREKREALDGLAGKPLPQSPWPWRRARR